MIFNMMYGTGSGEGGELSGISDAVLLWENSAPTTAFDAQNISVDLTDYDGVVIDYATYTNYPTRITSRIIPVWEGDSLMSCGVKDSNYGGRYCVVERDKVKFGYGHNHGTGITNNTSVPLAIYGVTGGHKLTTPVSAGATYLVRAFDKSAGEITAFQKVKAVSNNDSATVGWYFSDVGTGFTLLCSNETNSYTIMFAEDGGIKGGSGRVEVDVGFRAYNQANAVGLITSATKTALISADRSGTSYSNMITNFALYQPITTWSNAQSAYVFTTLTLSLSGLSSSTTYYLAACSGGANTLHLGGLCIREARLYSA